MDALMKKDLNGLKNLADQKTICWAEVSRLARDESNTGYMMFDFPAMNDLGVIGGERCVIYSYEADCDNAEPHLGPLLGRKIPFIILTIDEKAGRLMCSRAQAQRLLKESMLQQFQEKRLFRGVVVGFSQFGGYIEVNGVVGHIRNSDFTSDHSDIREYVDIGDTVNVRCKELNKEGFVFWEVVEKAHRSRPVKHDFEEDTVVVGKVVKISTFEEGVGVFVNVESGIDVLCPPPRDKEISEKSRVAVKIESIMQGKKVTDAPRMRGRIVRVL